MINPTFFQRQPPAPGSSNHHIPGSILNHLRCSTPEFFLLVALLIFAPLIEGGTTHTAVMGIRLMILLLLAVYLLRGIWAGTLSFPRLPITHAIVAYLSIAVISCVFSPYTNQSLQWLIVLFSYAALLYLIVGFITSWTDVAKLLMVLVGIGLFEAIWALIQGWWLGQPRPSGTFFNPNFLAGYLTAIVTICLGYLCYRDFGNFTGNQIQRGRRYHLSYGIGLIAILVLLLLAIIATGSRGGLLALLIGVSLVVCARFGFKGLGIVGLLLLIGTMVPNPTRDRVGVEHVANPLGYARWQIWQSSLHAIREHPFGVGLGLYQYVYPGYALPIEDQIARYGKIAQTAHNEYLQMTVELGVAAFLVFIWGVIKLAQVVARILRRRLEEWQRGIVTGVSGAIASILVHAAVDSNLHEPAVAIVLTLCTSIMISASWFSACAAEKWYMILVRSRVVWVLGSILIIGLLAVYIGRIGFAWVAFEKGSQEAKQMHFEKEVAWYRTAIALDPGKALYHSSLAAAYFQNFKQNGDNRLAQAVLTELRYAIALNPVDGRLLGLLGNVYVALFSSGVPMNVFPNSQNERPGGWLPLAVLAYERAIALEPFAPFYRFELAHLYLALGHHKKAEECIRQAVAIEPNFLPGRELLGQLYLEHGQLDAAREQYLEIVQRRDRYAGWVKDAFEERFLKVDVAALEKLLGEKTAL